MTIKNILDCVKGEVMCCEDRLDTEVNSACASDMMSDVLAFVKNQAVLVTGLCNPQVIRTAEMMDMKCIVLVRGKRPDAPMIDLATAKGIVIICVGTRMFATCGILHEAGLRADD